MSADNYIVIRPHPEGGFVNVMCFMSDETDEEDLGYEGERFSVLKLAVYAAKATYCEYGWTLEQSLSDEIYREWKR